MSDLLLGPALRHVGATDATVWVETARPATVAVRIGAAVHTERTWTVAGHHYALVEVTGLEPDTSSPYEVLVDDDLVWPEPDDDRPPCRIRTVSDGRRVRIAFGSCRYARSAAVHGDNHYDADALDCLSASMMHQSDDQWPDFLLMLGDQVYADETTPETRKRIADKRSLELPPGPEVADFEEYTWLYHESWTDPEVRWLLATLPSSMIFDDHDIRDDWNTSHSWREEMAQTSWWRERIVGGLSSYWVYQHIGNLAPADLAASEIYQQVRGFDGDAADLLREFAVTADAEADGGKGARWSYRRELGCARLLMIDSRCGRILADGQRSMVSEEEFAWISEQAQDVGSHLLIGTSLPWLLARALKHCATVTRGRSGPCGVRSSGAGRISSTGRPSGARSSDWPACCGRSRAGNGASRPRRCACSRATCTTRTCRAPTSVRTPSRRSTNSPARRCTTSSRRSSRSASGCSGAAASNVGCAGCSGWSTGCPTTRSAGHVRVAPGSATS